MPLSFGFYSDPALTTSAPALRVIVPIDGGDAIASCWFGSPTAAALKDAAEPGVGDVICEVFDSGISSGISADVVRLALSEAALDDAVDGQPLVLGTVVGGGVGNAIKVFARVSLPALPAGVFTDISLHVRDVIEFVNG